MPKSGDLTVCFGCGLVLAFDRRLRPQRIAASVLAALVPEEAAKLREVQEAVRSFLAAEAEEAR
jgi:hypothetical protein